MTHAQIISLLGEADSSADTAGRAFFAPQTSSEDRKRVLEFMLGEKRYGQIVSLMYCACLNGRVDMKKTSADYVAATGGNSTINTRYFSLFVQTALDCGISEAKFIPMIFLAATSDRKSRLYVWKSSSEWYLSKLAVSDYGRAWEYLGKNDTDFKLFSILIAADRERAVRDLTELAMFGKGVNKVAARKILRGYKSEVTAYVRPLYSSLKNDGKVAAVRLLLTLKNDPDVSAFLSEPRSNLESVQLPPASMSSSVRNSPALARGSNKVLCRAQNESESNSAGFCWVSKTSFAYCGHLAHFFIKVALSVIPTRKEIAAETALLGVAVPSASRFAAAPSATDLAS